MARHGLGEKSKRKRVKEGLKVEKKKSKREFKSQREKEFKRLLTIKGRMSDNGRMVTQLQQMEICGDKKRERFADPLCCYVLLYIHALYNKNFHRVSGKILHITESVSNVILNKRHEGIQSN